MTDATVVTVAAGAAAARRSKVTDGWTRLRRNHMAVTGMVIFTLIVLICVFGPMLLSIDPEAQDYTVISEGPSLTNGHLFGTDDLGRDLLVRIMMGSRISLEIGVLGALIAVVIGTTYGAIAGYAGGAVDQLMMRIVDVLYGLPFLFFVIMLGMVFERGMLTILIAIGSLIWLTTAVIVRGQTLSLKQKEFIEAARAGGMKPLSIIRRHIVPNTIGPVIVYASLLVPEVILGESFLSYLGLGLDSSLGALISDGAKALDVAPYQLRFPGATLALILFSLNFVADGLRDAFDPKDR
jgi:oligopeptide transport system permease protein